MPQYCAVVCLILGLASITLFCVGFALPYWFQEPVDNGSSHGIWQKRECPAGGTCSMSGIGFGVTAGESLCQLVLSTLWDNEEASEANSSHLKFAIFHWFQWFCRDFHLCRSNHHNHQANLKCGEFSQNESIFCWIFFLDQWSWELKGTHNMH
jgi:hypothetical protein